MASNDRQTGGERERRGGVFYDQSGVFDRYKQHRAWPLNPNRTLEEPPFMEEVGSLIGLRVLDLGCGDGATGTAFLAAGCATYTGIDGSRLMIEAARATLDGTAGTATLGDIEDFEAQPGSYDLIVSRMVFHYLADVRDTMRKCHDSLAAGGRIIITVTHPVITSHDVRASTDEPRQDWLVDDYFIEGPRPQVWLGSSSVWHHRTIETYVDALLSAGFQLTTLRECGPRPDLFDEAAEFERRRRIPLILLIAGTKP